MQKLLLLPIVLLLVSCAAPKPAPNAFQDAEAAIDAAVKAGAEEHSPVELRFAREKMAEAQKGMEYKSYEKAIYLIDQSEINSELAIEKSRAAITRGKVTELERENEMLRDDFESTFGGEFK
jgi:hypothetical protein